MKTVLMLALMTAVLLGAAYSQTKVMPILVKPPAAGTNFVLLVDNASFLLLVDNSSKLCRAGGC